VVIRGNLPPGRGVRDGWGWKARREALYGRWMETFTPTPGTHTLDAELDLLLNDSDLAFTGMVSVEEEPRPDAVDAMNAQILAGLVCP